MGFHVHVYKKKGGYQEERMKKERGRLMHLSALCPIKWNHCVSCRLSYIKQCCQHFQERPWKKIQFVTSETHFYFNEDIYESVDCGDGFSIGSSSCQFLMVHHEEYWLIQEKALSVLFNKRYVDDIFCIFETEDADKFLDFFNNMHENIRFGQNISRWCIQS